MTPNKEPTIFNDAPEDIVQQAIELVMKSNEEQVKKILEILFQ